MEPTKWTQLQPSKGLLLIYNASIEIGDIEWYFVFVVPARWPCLGFKSTAWVNCKFRLVIITPNMYHRCTMYIGWTTCYNVNECKWKIPEFFYPSLPCFSQLIWNLNIICTLHQVSIELQRMVCNHRTRIYLPCVSYISIVIRSYSCLYRF